MKKLMLGVVVLTALVLTGLPAAEVEAAEPTCSYRATVTAIHATCGPVTIPVSGWTMASCQSNLAYRINWLNDNPLYSNAAVAVGCHAVGTGCKVVAHEDDQPVDTGADS